ncbi:MAG TPA: hypothetical protein VFS42_09895 [Burkholderiaceae bacterium]|nr:hypothetical protein [Burkholderiaceae bacterium]
MQTLLLDEARSHHPQWYLAPIVPFRNQDRAALIELVKRVADSRLALTPNSLNAPAIASMFREVDGVVTELEGAQAIRLPQLRFQLRSTVFEHVCDQRPMHAEAFLDAYRDAGYFLGKDEIPSRYARARIENAVEQKYGCARPTTTRRIRTNDLPHIDQGNFVLHVCGLFNLEKQADERLMSEFAGKMQRLNPPAHAHIYRLSNAQPGWLKQPVKLIVHDLLDMFSSPQHLEARFVHNIHPASVLLEVSTGFVFHPVELGRRPVRVSPLAGRDHPLAFKNISDVLVRKFLNARAHDTLDDFLETAFDRSNPCYEAVTTHLAQYQPDSSSAVILPACPSWNNTLTPQENVNALIEWEERHAFFEYAAQEGFRPQDKTPRQIDEIICSRPYAEFFAARLENTIDQLKHRVDASHHQTLRTQLEDYVASSLAFATRVL